MSYRGNFTVLVHIVFTVAPVVQSHILQCQMSCTLTQAVGNLPAFISYTAIICKRSPACPRVRRSGIMIVWNQLVIATSKKNSIQSNFSKSQEGWGPIFTQVWLMEILEALRFRQSWKIGLWGPREAEFHLGAFKEVSPSFGEWKTFFKSGFVYCKGLSFNWCQS